MRGSRKSRQKQRRLVLTSRNMNLLKSHSKRLPFCIVTNHGGEVALLPFKDKLTELKTVNGLFNSEWSLRGLVENYFSSHWVYDNYMKYDCYKKKLTLNLIKLNLVFFANFCRLRRQQRPHAMPLVKCTDSGTMRWWDWPMVKWTLAVE